MRRGFLTSHHAADAEPSSARSGGAKARAKAAAAPSTGSEHGLPSAWPMWPGGLPRIATTAMPSTWRITPAVVFAMASRAGVPPDTIEVRTVLEAPDSPAVRAWAELQHADDCIGVCIVAPITFEAARGQGACRDAWSRLASGQCPDTWMHMAFARSSVSGAGGN